MKKNVLIIGVGNLGARYLQGLRSCKTPLSIYICDPSYSAIHSAKKLWEEVASEKAIHSLSVVELHELPQIIDLAIVCTNADIRPNVICAIRSEHKVVAWIVEKVIAQSDDGLSKIEDCTSSAEHVYVNLPRCIMPWYKEIKEKIVQSGDKKITVSGGRWGLACNSIHHLHLISYLTGESIVAVTVNEDKNNLWYETKRKGFYDFFGTIEAEFSRGSSSKLICTDDQEDFTIRIKGSSQNLEINETRGVANYSNGEFVAGVLQYQSQITASIVDSILSGEGCGLPKLRDVNEMQRILLKALRIHWNRCFDQEMEVIPIT